MAEKAIRFGVELADLPSDVERTPEYDMHSANGLQFMAEQGIDSKTVQSMYTDFEKLAIAFPGARPSADALDDLQGKYTKSVGEENIKLLRRWIETEVYPE